MKRKLISLLTLSLILLCSCNKEKTNYDNENEENRGKFSIADSDISETDVFSGKKYYKRIYDEYKMEFLPSDDYGKILPFVGKAKVYNTSDEEDYNTSEVYMTYGFCTTDGRIITDPSSDIAYVYHDCSKDGFGYYCLVPDSESGRSVLIPDDGTWALELEENSWISYVNGGYIAVDFFTDYEASLTKIYDYSGNFLKEFENDGATLYGISNGLFLFVKYSDIDLSYSFLNLEGETVFGPYSEAFDFNKYGITAVSDFNGDSYLMDIYGNRLTDVPYKNITTVQNNGECVAFRAWQTENGFVSDIYYPNGDFITSISNELDYSDIIVDEGDVIFGFYTEDGYKYRFSDGTPIISEKTGKETNEYCPHDGVFRYENEDNGECVLFDKNGKTVSSLFDVEYICGINDDKNIVVYVSGKSERFHNEETDENIVTDNSRINVYDVTKKEIVFSVEGSGGATFYGKNGRYLCISACKDDGTPFGGLSQYYLFDVEKEKAMFENCMDISVEIMDDKEYYTICKKNSCTLYDGDFNILVKTYNE